MTRSFFEIWARNPHTFRSRHVDRWVVDMNFDCSNRGQDLAGLLYVSVFVLQAPMHIWAHPPAGRARASLSCELTDDLERLHVAR